jgi:hypothetical protein
LPRLPGTSSSREKIEKLALSRVQLGRAPPAVVFELSAERKIVRRQPACERGKLRMIGREHGAATMADGTPSCSRQRQRMHCAKFQANSRSRDQLDLKGGELLVDDVVCDLDLGRGSLAARAAQPSSSGPSARSASARRTNIHHMRQRIEEKDGKNNQPGDRYADRIAPKASADLLTAATHARLGSAASTRVTSVVFELIACGSADTATIRQSDCELERNGGSGGNDGPG